MMVHPPRLQFWVFAAWSIHLAVHLWGPSSCMYICMYSWILVVSSQTVAVTLASLWHPSLCLVYSLKELDLGWNPACIVRSCLFLISVVPISIFEPAYYARGVYDGSRAYDVIGVDPRDVDKSQCLAHSWHTAWCHTCRRGDWLLLHFRTSILSHSLRWSGWGSSGLCSTAEGNSASPWYMLHLIVICAFGFELAFRVVLFW